MNNILNWLTIKWWAFQEWLESFEPCPKEQMGYSCRHAILSNGQKECGTEHNYWRGDDE